VTVPSDSAELHYFFSAIDPTGNWARLPDVTVPISDNDPPYISIASVPTEGTTGDAFEVHPTITDNIAIDKAYVEYWFGAGVHSNVTLSSADGYAVSIDIPSTSTDALQFFLTTVDTAGHWYETDLMSVPIRDDDSPTFGTDSTPTETNTGEVVTFTVVASDNIGVASVTVEYWFGAGAHAQKSMGGTGTYSYELTMPDDIAEPLSYIFKALDAAGNQQTTTVKSVTIADIVLPTLGADASDTVAENGEKFTFKVTASDNIGVTSVTVEYWFGAGAHTQRSMGGTGTYSYELTVPDDIVEPLSYVFKALDAAGNQQTTTVKTVTVVDTVLPTLDADASDAVAVNGQDFNFKVQASDNIGVSTVMVKYRFGSDAYQEKAMTSGTTGFAYEIAVPSSETRAMGYVFVASDAKGNTVSSSEYTRTLVDKTAPVFGSDASGEVVNAGQPFVFVARWSDNTGISKAYVIYWFEGQDPLNMSMTRDGSDYMCTLKVPGNAKGKLSYQFKAQDQAGNWQQSSVNELTVTAKKEEKKGLSTGLLSSIILIAILVVILLLYVAMRRGKAPAEAAPAPPPSTPVVVEAPGVTKGAVGAAPAAQVVTPPPPGPAVAPAAAAGRFRVLNVKTQCASCSGQVERGASAYVCNCGIALHEKCAAKVKACPNCKAEIRFG